MREKRDKTRTRSVLDSHTLSKHADILLRVPKDLEKKEIVALIAYLQRLGTDIKKSREPITSK